MGAAWQRRSGTPKKKVKLTARIPEYGDLPGRRGLDWRESMHGAVLKAAGKQFPEWDQDPKAPLLAGVKLDVNVRLYLRTKRLQAQDVDNLVKHVLDALQGRLGGKGKKARTRPARIIDSDASVYRVTVEKFEKRRTGKPWSRLVVRDYAKTDRG
jgi:hypothetical protein